MTWFLLSISLLTFVSDKKSPLVNERRHENTEVISHLPDTGSAEIGTVVSRVVCWSLGLVVA